MEPGKRPLGKVAIVTGGASGIGAATARLFAQHGASVLLTDSNASLGKSIETEIASAGGTASFGEQDVRSEGRWSAIVDQAEKAWGRIDILCNIAGISARRGHRCVDEARMDRVHADPVGGVLDRRRLGKMRTAPLEAW